MQAYRNEQKLMLKKEILVGWQPLLDSWCMLNMDGSLKGLLDISGCRGLVKNNEGRWVTGLCCELRSC